MTPQLLTVTEAASQLAIGRRTLERLIQTGALPSVRIGRSVRIDAADLAFMIHDRKGVVVEAYAN